MSAQRRWLFPLLTLAVFTAFGLSKFAHLWLDDLARAHPNTLPTRLIEELTGAYSAGLVFLALVWTVYRFPFEAGQRLRRLPGYVLLVAVLALVHTTLMWGSRSLLFPLAGLGPYDYGIMRYRYPMEFALQAPNLVLMLIAIHAWRWYRRQRDRELETAQLARELSQSRLERLEAQLQPHFLFNSLNVISSLMYHDPGRADQMLGRLSDLLRLTFRRSPTPEVTLAEELEWLGWYLEIMQLRFGDRLSVSQEIAPDALRLAVPRLLLQPLVENALKHGAAKRAGPARVMIAAALNGDRLRLSVEDDGPGLAGSAPDGSVGVGLTNTRSRLQVLYGDSARFTLASRAEGGLSVSIELPARVIRLNDD